MKNLFWAVGSVIVAVLLSLLLHSTTGSQLGAISSPATNMDYLVLSQALGFGDTGNTPKVNVTGSRSALSSTASNVPCTIQNPFNATSTILSFSLNVTTASSSAIGISVGTTTSATATSSGMISTTVAANSLATLSWGMGVNNGVIGPSQYITAGASAGTAPIIWGGSCNATFVSST